MYVQFKNESYREQLTWIWGFMGENCRTNQTRLDGTSSARIVHRTVVNRDVEKNSVYFVKKNFIYKKISLDEAVWCCKSEHNFFYVWQLKNFLLI
ncbi:hypothetical protein C0J52_15870 [Blattella germanica]|nr:hypothetical protein C0J52_15870 [Blattella germanica]